MSSRPRDRITHKKRERDPHSNGDSSHPPVASSGTGRFSASDPDPAVMALVPRFGSEEPLSGPGDLVNIQTTTPESETVVPERAWTAEDLVYRACRTYFQRTDDIVTFKDTGMPDAAAD